MFVGTMEDSPLFFAAYCSCWRPSHSRCNLRVLMADCINGDDLIVNRVNRVTNEHYTQRQPGMAQFINNGFK